MNELEIERLRFKKRLITVRGSFGGAEHPINSMNLTAECSEHFGVHKSVTRTHGGPSFTVTHLLSGYRVQGDLTRTQARTLCELLESIPFDWTQTPDEIRGDQAIAAAARESVAIARRHP